MGSYWTQLATGCLPLLLAAAALAPTHALATPPPLPARSASAADGAALYARYCALCHGANREGHAADHAPSLRSPELMGAAPRAFLAAAIAYGRPGTPMAGFASELGGPLDAGAQRVLLDWLLAQAAAPPYPLVEAPVRGDATRGKAVYAEHCASCHGDAGQGVAGPALANPVLLATASDAQLRDAIARGRTGTPMMAFDGKLSGADLDAVTAHLRSWATPWTPPQPALVAPPPLDQAVQNPTAAKAKLPVLRQRYVAAADVAAALAAGKRLVLLDARPVSDWQRAHLPGALPVPFYDGIDAIAKHLPNDGTPIVAYCACPHAASGRVVEALRAAGFSTSYVLDEGSIVWQDRGYPMVGSAVATPK